MTTVRVHDALEVVRQVLRRKTVQTTVNQHTDLEVDTFRRLQPVQVAQYRRDVVVSRRTMNQSGGSIEDRLQTLVLVGRKPCECRVAFYPSIPSIPTSGCNFRGRHIDSTRAVTLLNTKRCIVLHSDSKWS